MVQKSHCGKKKILPFQHFSPVTFMVQNKSASCSKSHTVQSSSATTEDVFFLNATFDEQHDSFLQYYLESYLMQQHNNEF